MKALVLAAGRSTRISGIADGLPKPLLEIGGAPVIVHQLRLLARHGVREAWVNLHYRPDFIQNALGDGSKWGLRLRYSRELELLGTAGAAKNLIGEFYGESFFVLYGDNYTDCDLTGLLRRHRDSGAVGTIAVFDQRKNPNSGIAGGKVALDGDGNALGFVEGSARTVANGTLVNAGVYILEPAVLDAIGDPPSDFGRDVFPKLLREGKRLAAYPLTGFCFGIDTPEAYERAREFAEEMK